VEFFCAGRRRLSDVHRRTAECCLTVVTRRTFCRIEQEVICKCAADIAMSLTIAARPKEISFSKVRRARSEFQFDLAKSAFCKCRAGSTVK